MVSFALIGHPLAFMQWTHASTAWRCGATRVAEVMRTRAPQEHVPWPRILAWLALIAQKVSCTSSGGGSASRARRRRERCTGEGWFTEGFDTADLLEAKARLAELAG